MITLSSANYIYQTSKKYFVVCGNCEWVSPKTTSQSDASKMEFDHTRATSHYSSSTVEYDNEKSNRYTAYCSKCSWESPTVTSKSDASKMQIDHTRATSHYSCSVIEK